jgi:3-methyl-2-oxobutanoate hydroxymethyltransferase
LKYHPVDLQGITNTRRMIHQYLPKTVMYSLQKYYPIRSNPLRTVTTLSLSYQKRRGRKITMVTAYDFPSAMHVQRANIDMILVGDSAAMVELGYDTTQPITLEQMIHHCQAVYRGVQASMKRSNHENPKKPLLVGDMPFGTYEYNDVDIALRNAYRMVKEGGMDAVKLEGGSERRAEAIKHLVDGGGE